MINILRIMAFKNVTSYKYDLGDPAHSKCIIVDNYSDINTCPCNSCINLLSLSHNGIFMITGVYVFIHLFLGGSCVWTAMTSF